jgi:uncharacterized repeat protein (TIGR01451 family)
MEFHQKTIEDDTPEEDDDDIGDELEAIYSSEDGELPDLTHMKRRRKKRFRGLITLSFFTIVVLLGSFSLAWGLFKTQDRFSGSGVTVTITAPEQATSGDELTYVIHYANREPQILGNVELAVRYPSGFVLTKAEPEPDNITGTEAGATWSIGTLAREREDSIVITGTLVGALGDVALLQATLTYKPANFNAEFQEVATAETAIEESFLAVDVDGPEVVLPEAEAVYTITATNTTDTSVDAVTVQVLVPNNFTIRETDPVRSGIVPRWTIDRVKPDEEFVITIRGAYPKGASGAHTIRAEIGFGSGAGFVLQESGDTLTNVVDGDVLVGLSMNGSSSGEPIQLGQLLTYTTTITNNASSAIEDVTVRATIDSPLIDWGTLQVDGDVTRESTGATWTPTAFRALLRIGAGESVTLPFRVRVASTIAASAADASIVARVGVDVGKADDLPTPLTIESNTITSQLNTDLDLGVSARYFSSDGTTIGSGPLPPRVGETTEYRVEWDVTNSIHEVLSAKVQTTLPLGVAYVQAGHVSHGTLLYQPASRTVEWTLNRLEAGMTEIDIEFIVRITPTIEQVGSIVSLTGPMTLVARDRVTSGRIVLSRAALTTSLDGDEFGQGKGVVRE